MTISFACAGSGETVHCRRRAGGHEGTLPALRQLLRRSSLIHGGGTGAWANPATQIAISGFNPATKTAPGPCAVNCNNVDEVYGFHSTEST